jgi:hypothetical protein
MRPNIPEFALVLTCGLALSLVSSGGAQEPPSGGEPVAIPTLGGKQFWADVLWLRGWRIQENVFSGRHRLLDDADYSHAQGSYEHCLAMLEDVKRARNFAPLAGKAVILMHGLGRSRASMKGIADYLQREGGYVVVNVSYPSTRGAIGDHTKRVRHLIEHLDGFEELNFVAHSMGNIVLRHYFADIASVDGPPSPHPRFGRMVMLGPPNQASELAHKLGRYRTFGWIMGRGAMELGQRWDKLEPHLAAPPIEFGIIAGGREQEAGFNPLVNGDNDWIVSVDTTKLAGAADFTVLPVLHTFMMDDPTVQEQTLRFLREGHFVSADERRPLVADVDQPESGPTKTAPP